MCACRLLQFSLVLVQTVSRDILASDVGKLYAEVGVEFYRQVPWSSYWAKLIAKAEDVDLLKTLKATGPDKSYISMASPEPQLGGTIGSAEIDLFAKIREKSNVRSIFKIGSSFGYSAFVLRSLFPNATIDIIDAEEDAVHVRNADIFKSIVAESGRRPSAAAS